MAPTYIGAPGIAVPKRPIRVGRFLVSDDLLHALLKLPQGCQVTHMTYNHAKYAYEVSVIGDESSGLPQRTDGCEVELLKPHYKEDFDKNEGPVFDGWGR